MAQNQWISMLRKLGHHVTIHNLRSLHVDPRVNLPNFVQEVAREKPEIIFVEGALGFNLPEFYLDPIIQQIPVAAFWFDDPLRSVDYRMTEKGYLEALRLPNVYHFVWDGYWRKWLLELHQIRSYPIHLAADPEEFYPLPPPSEYRDYTVFIGTLIHPKQIEDLKQQLHPTLHHIASMIPPRVESEAYGKSPYDLLDATVANLPPKMLQAYHSLKEQKPEAILHLRTFCWMLGKNEVRKRILKKTLEIAPLLIFSGNWEQTHSNEEALRSILGDSNRLLVLDTRNLASQSLASLYAFGKLHLQATDPQSIEGGLPFRVFQTTACRRPLLTDKKPELQECYSYETELLTFDSDADFLESLEKALADSHALEKVAEQGYRRFLREHTWAHRFDYVRNTIK